MKIKLLAVINLVVLGISWALAQQPPQQPPHDPIGENLFPPELLMQNQKALGLTEEQKNIVKAEMQKAQTKFTDVQWSLQTEVETLAGLLKQDRVDEQQVLSQLDKVLNLEREMKKTQITLMVRIKNKLSSEQQAQLREMKMQEPAQMRENRKRMEER